MFLIKYYLEEKVRQSKNNAVILMKAGQPVVVEEVSTSNRPGSHAFTEPQTHPKHGSSNVIEPMKISQQADGDDVERAVERSDSEYLIEFNDISLILPNGVQIMKGVTGKFQPRRLCAIMGPSGAG